MDSSAADTEDAFFQCLDLSDGDNAPTPSDAQSGAQEDRESEGPRSDTETDAFSQVSGSKDGEGHQDEWNSWTNAPWMSGLRFTVNPFDLFGALVCPDKHYRTHGLSKGVVAGVNSGRKQAPDRIPCPGCGHRKRLICWTCMRPTLYPDRIPQVKLPCSVDVIHYQCELLSKSTALHGRILAPDHIRFVEYPDLPDYDPNNTFLLYPSKNALSISDVKINSDSKLLVIDSAWAKSLAIAHDPRLVGLKFVKIEDSKSYFWRYQHLGESCLSTIEAIYHFFRQYADTHQDEFNDSPYGGQYDDLLFYYAYMYDIIQETYRRLPEERREKAKLVRKKKSFFQPAAADPQ